MSADYEKRENFRVPLDTKVEFSINGDFWHQGRTRNISYTGLLLRGDKALSPGQDLEVSFHLPNTDPKDAIEARARVARVTARRGQPVELALVFTSFRPGCRKQVDQYVERLRG